VGPAGLPRNCDINDLEKAETIECPDASACLSHRYVSMLSPAKMRSPAAANGRANRKSDFNKPEEVTETTADVQVRSLRRQFALVHHIAVTVAQLAWGGLPR
jgi:hypothetical protein